MKESKLIRFLGTISGRVNECVRKSSEENHRGVHCKGSPPLLQHHKKTRVMGKNVTMKICRHFQILCPMFFSMFVCLFSVEYKKTRTGGRRSHVKTMMNTREYEILVDKYGWSVKEMFTVQDPPDPSSDELLLPPLKCLYKTNVRIQERPQPGDSRPVFPPSRTLV